MTAGNKTDHVEMLILRRGIIRSEYFRLLFGNWTHAKTMRCYLKTTRKSLAPTLNTIVLEHAVSNRIFMKSFSLILSL